MKQIGIAKTFQYLGVQERRLRRWVRTPDSF
jgi:hypothetical protein